MEEDGGEGATGKEQAGAGEEEALAVEGVGEAVEEAVEEAV